MFDEFIPHSEDERGIREAELWGAAEGSATGARRSPGPLPWPRELADDSRLPGERTDERTALMVLLIHTARALAASQITIANGFERIAICAACGEQTPAGIPARHRMTCLAAEVNSIVARLCRTLEANPQRREDATRGR